MMSSVQDAFSKLLQGSANYEWGMEPDLILCP
jgi:hypothetical protein